MLPALQRCQKNFERAVKLDGWFANAFNNIGRDPTRRRRFPKANKNLSERAIGLRQDSASFFEQLCGAAFYMRKE